jgi:hypothetical protein
MAESQYKQACMIDPEGRARQVSQQFPGRFTATGGTGAENLAYVLNAIGVPAWKTDSLSATRLFDYFYAYCSERTPIIAHIGWTGGGGHFTLLKQIDSDHRMIFLDPWYDIVEVERRNLPNYGIVGGTMRGWLTIPHR